MEKKNEKPLNLSKKPKQVKSKTKCVIHFTKYDKEEALSQLSKDGFNKIKEVAELRQSLVNNKERLDNICLGIPTEFVIGQHFYHRKCYREFTRTSRLEARLPSGGGCFDPVGKGTKRNQTSSPEAAIPTRRRTSDESSSPLFPQEKCLFCDKKRIKVSGKEQSLVTCVTKTAEASIKSAAEEKNDNAVLCKIQEMDLVAREARYHPDCRKRYTRPSRDKKESSEAEDDQLLMQNKAHQAAFANLCEHVDQAVIQGGNVERISMLRERYLAYLLANFPQYYNESYKMDKLKTKLINHFGTSIQFWRPNYRSELVYAYDLPKGQAIEVAFETAASELKRLEEAALIIRREILSAQRKSAEMPWPPSAAFLKSDTIQPSLHIKHFLEQLIAGKEQLSEQKERIVSSISQDICKAVTNGQWIMPKHLLLGMTLRHLTGSAEVVSILNRYGHCVSYSRLLELETAICAEIEDKDCVIPATINPQENVVTHLCWDNFDLNEETPTGAGTTHTAHGIIIQEVSEGAQDDLVEHNNSSNQVSKTKKRTVKVTTQVIEPCFAENKAEPCLTVSKTKATNTQAEDKARFSDSLWILCRRLMQPLPTMQIVPSWAGWVSLTMTGANTLLQQSAVDYMDPVFSPVTENSTVQHLLKVSQKATKEVQQQYTIVTFDLAVAKKAYSIIWQNPDVFKDVIVRLGSFHLLCSYMGALGKMMRCSGFEEILVQAGVCASSSIEQVMNGKHYNRALRVHKILYEALERLLLSVFDTGETSAIDENAKKALLILANDPCEETLSAATTNPSCRAYVNRYTQFKERVREGTLGKTAQFWLSYIDKVQLMLLFQRATKTNDLDLHLFSLQGMGSLFFSYDRPNYARYSTVYMVILLNLAQSHPGAEELLRSNGFSVCRSEVPFSRNAVDITIEQTINRHAKSQGGIIGFSRNASAYHRWCKTRHARASYVQATKEATSMESLDDQGSVHKDTRKAQIARSEEDTVNVIEAINSFLNPFDVEDKDVLYCVSSGASIAEDVAQDLLNADKIGTKARDAFILERLIDKKTKFHAPLKKLNLKTFSSSAKSKVVKGQTKSREITAERNVFGQLVILALEHEINLENVLCFPLGPVSWPLATADGVPVKTEKAKLMHVLEDQRHIALRPDPSTSTYIVDGNALLQSLVSLPPTFGELAENVFDQLPKVPRVDFVTDSYFPQSIKGIERSRRGTSKAHLLKGPATKVPRDWKAFLRNDENKKNLSSFLLKQWKSDAYAQKLQGRGVVIVTQTTCVRLTSVNGASTLSEQLDEIVSTQEEADTKIILHLDHVATSSSEESTIVIRSPDTDVFILLLMSSVRVRQTVLFDTGTGNKRRLLDIKSVAASVGQEICSALPGLHAFTGCDTTSAFVRKGKVKPYQIMKKNPQFVAAFQDLGTDVNVSNSTCDILEQFTCLMYGSRLRSINEVRYLKFRERFSVKPGLLLDSYSGVDMSLFPPCYDSLLMHIKRSNYQALVWRKAGEKTPCIPGPDGNGWEVDSSGHLECKWTDGDLMPQQLADIIADQDPNQESDDDLSDYELDNPIDIIFQSEDIV